MKQQIPLRRFEYCIAGPDATATGRKIWDKHSIEMHIRLTTIDIDFEKKNLCLEGEGIKVNTTIYPGFGIDLSDKASDGLVFSLDGTLDDGKTISSCSGLLVLHSAMEKKDRNGSDWHLALYLYDNYNDEREIKLNLTMWPFAKNAELN